MKILLINSIPDFITEMRIDTISKRPQLSEHQIFHTYILNKFKEYLTAEELVEKFVKEIEKNDPDIIIVHAGIGFRNLKSEMIKTLIVLKGKFNHIKIGIEKNRLSEGVLLDCCDYSKEMQNLLELFFRH